MGKEIIRIIVVAFVFGSVTSVLVSMLAKNVFFNRRWEGWLVAVVVSTLITAIFVGPRDSIDRGVIELFLVCDPLTWAIVPSFAVCTLVTTASFSLGRKENREKDDQTKNVSRKQQV